MSYQPSAGSLAARVCAFFRANPTRKLTAAEICDRFNATRNSMAMQIGAAEDADLLTSEFVGRTNVYSAGPLLSRWSPAAGDVQAADQVTAPPPAAVPAGAPARRPVRVALPAVASLKIEDGVPLPSASTPVNGGQFDPVFAAMTPGQSFEQPNDIAKSLKASADRWAKQYTQGKVKFAMRRVTDTTSRVWRKE